MFNCPVCRLGEPVFFSTARDRLDVKPGTVYTVKQCSHCAYGWTEPQPPEDELSSYYLETYLGDTEKTVNEFLAGKLRGTASWRMETEKVALVEKYVKGGSLLDVGCGEGKFLWALDAEQWTREGVDFNQEVVELVNGRIPDLTLRCTSIHSEELPEKSFDAITFWHVLEHLPEPRRVLKRVHRLLKPGGVVFLSVPNICSYQARWFRHHWFAFGDVPRHLHHFSEQSLKILLDDAGLTFLENVFFSRAVNFHCWKHSLRAWTKDQFGSSVPYLFTKPLLHFLPILESVSGQYAVMTLIAVKK